MREPARCPVHDEPLLRGHAPAQFGLVLNSHDYLRQREPLFPCSRTVVQRGCCGGGGEQKEHPVEYCRACRRAEKEWYVDHPVALPWQALECDETLRRAARHHYPDLLFTDTEVDEQLRRIRETIADMKRRGVEPKPAPSPMDQRSWEVRVTGLGDNRLRAMMGIRRVMKLSLQEAKAFADNMPEVVCTGVNTNTAAATTKQLRAAGLTVEKIELPEENGSNR